MNLSQSVDNLLLNTNLLNHTYGIPSISPDDYYTLYSLFNEKIDHLLYLSNINNNNNINSTINNNINYAFSRLNLKHCLLDYFSQLLPLLNSAHKFKTISQNFSIPRGNVFNVVNTSAGAGGKKGGGFGEKGVGGGGEKGENFGRNNFGGVGAGGAGGAGGVGGVGAGGVGGVGAGGVGVGVGVGGVGISVGGGGGVGNEGENSGRNFGGNSGNNFGSNSGRNFRSGERATFEGATSERATVSGTGDFTGTSDLNQVSGDFNQASGSGDLNQVSGGENQISKNDAEQASVTGDFTGTSDLNQASGNLTNQVSGSGDLNQVSGGENQISKNDAEQASVTGDSTGTGNFNQVSGGEISRKDAQSSKRVESRASPSDIRKKNDGNLNEIENQNNELSNLQNQSNALNLNLQNQSSKRNQTGLKDTLKISQNQLDISLLSQKIKRYNYLNQQILEENKNYLKKRGRVIKTLLNPDYQLEESDPNINSAPASNSPKLFDEESSNKSTSEKSRKEPTDISASSLDQNDIITKFTKLTSKWRDLSKMCQFLPILITTLSTNWYDDETLFNMVKTCQNYADKLDEYQAIVNSDDVNNLTVEELLLLNFSELEPLHEEIGT